VLHQQSLAHAIGTVQQTAGTHRNQLFETVTGLFEGVGRVGLFDGRTERQLAGAPEALESGVEVRIYRDAS
jgi:hypothetical protein